MNAATTPFYWPSLYARRMTCTTLSSKTPQDATEAKLYSEVRTSSPVSRVGGKWNSLPSSRFFQKAECCPSGQPFGSWTAATACCLNVKSAVRGILCSHAERGKSCKLQPDTSVCLQLSRRSRSRLAAASTTTTPLPFFQLLNFDSA